MGREFDITILEPAAFGIDNLSLNEWFEMGEVLLSNVLSYQSQMARDKQGPGSRRTTLGRYRTPIVVVTIDGLYVKVLHLHAIAGSPLKKALAISRRNFAHVGSVTRGGGILHGCRQQCGAFLAGGSSRG